MGILVDKNTTVLVQGITGRYGSYHTKLMLDYGTKIVAGVTPGKGGLEVHGVPVYDTVEEAVNNHDIDASIIFVPGPFVKDAALEALKNGIKLVVIITEHVPVNDALHIMEVARRQCATVIGPNCPGIINPGETKLGIMPGHVFKKGKVGILSRSGTLMYEISSLISDSGLGVSTAVGLGGDPIIGMTMVEALRRFQCDSETEAVVILGEIGGSSEIDAAQYIKSEFTKPVVAYFAGRTAPKGKRMGHAGAIVSGEADTIEAKEKAIKNAGGRVAHIPSEIPLILKEVLER
ncbi:succinate--CoA ligase subunit alpha [bacterium 3DAC]|nr:succinate--CoA ligase subunit alpha [Dictyoglomota bacterium]UZN22795.1 succinate--CoA ligase subunit alpha [bacterium 3DAC]